jgi:hypothetical protein
MKFTVGVLVGCGGTGSILAEPLARLLAYHKNGTRQMVLMDGDKFEKKNLVRQLFSPKLVGKNKAEVIANRLEGISNVKVVPSYINKTSFVAEMMSLPEPSKMVPLVITAVDNHASRKAIIEGLDDMPLQDFACLIPGNELASGRVSVYLKYKGQVVTGHPLELYPEIKDPTDKIPGGCAKQAPSTPQLISANMGAALTCLEISQALLDGAGFHREIHFNTLTFKQLGQEDILMEPQAPAPAKPKSTAKKAKVALK